MRTMIGMPPKKRKQAMTGAEFRKLMGDRKQGEVARLLGVSIRSVNRWANSDGIISPTVAAAIRAALSKE